MVKRRGRIIGVSNEKNNVARETREKKKISHEIGTEVA